MESKKRLMAIGLKSALAVGLFVAQGEPADANLWTCYLPGACETPQTCESEGLVDSGICSSNCMDGSTIVQFIYCG